MEPRPAATASEAKEEFGITPCKQRAGGGCTENAVRAAAHRGFRRGIGALVVAGGCATAGCVSAPEITVTSVDVVEIGSDAAELAIRMTLENKADVPVKLDIWDYHLRAGSRSYAGRWSAGLTVPPMQTVTTSLPAVVPLSVSPGPSCAWETGGSVTFLAPSRLAQVLFELGLNRPTASFSGRGASMGEGGPAPSTAPASESGGP